MTTGETSIDSGLCVQGRTRLRALSGTRLRALSETRLRMPDGLDRLTYATITSMLIVVDLGMTALFLVVASALSTCGSARIYPRELTWITVFETAVAVMTPLLVFGNLHYALSSMHANSEKALAAATAHLRSGGCLRKLNEPPSAIAIRNKFARRAKVLILCGLLLQYLTSLLFAMYQFRPSGLFQ